MKKNLTKNIAILAPSKNAYSETFIQAHKELLAGNIFYYYGSLENTTLEGRGILNKTNKKLFYKFKKFFLKKSHVWYYEQFFLESFKKNKIEVIFAEYGPTAQQCLSIAQKLNLPLIVHFHGFDASVFDILRKFRNYKEVFDYATYIVVVSKKMYQDLMDLGCPQNKLVYNVYGPNDDFLIVEPQFLKSQFIALGRFVDKKAPYYLILSFSKVVKEYPKAKLFIAGEGVLWATCKNLIKALELEDNVTLLGVISPEIFRKYLSESIGFVQHSVTAENGDSEGTPVAILEASGAGIPVIATYHAGIPDVIVDRESGLLVEEHDYISMAARMMELLKDREYAMKLGRTGKERIKQYFSLKRHIKVLDGLIAEAGGG